MTESELLRTALAARDAGRDHAIITIVKTLGSTPRRNGKLLVFASGEAVGTIGGGEIERIATLHALECIRAGRGDFVEYDLSGCGVRMACGGDMSLLTEVFRAKPRLYICGAGHVGLALASIARSTGFEVAFFDGRDPANLTAPLDERDRYIRCADIRAAIEAEPVPEGAYFAIMTHGHERDAEALSAALHKKAAYIGMIGSKNKTRAVFSRLLDEGESREALSLVYAPIGLDIGGETPEEIALSVAAQLVAVRYARSGGHLGPSPALIKEV